MKNTQQPTYLLKDENVEAIEGYFYEEEMLEEERDTGKAVNVAKVICLM